MTGLVGSDCLAPSGYWTKRIILSRVEARGIDWARVFAIFNPIGVTYNVLIAPSIQTHGQISR
jgi:hypothetical protein